jgi:hypothetical protein
MANANVSNPNFNITWMFSVDPDFNYFVRMYFCDIVSLSLQQLIFNVYTNSQIAIGNLDLSTKTLSLSTPYYTDFVVNASSGSRIKHNAAKAGAKFIGMILWPKSKRSQQ